MAKKNDFTRVSFNLYLDNPEHKRVYEILQEQKNKNAYIRDAVLSYERGYKSERVTKDEIRQIMVETMQEQLEPLQKLLQEQKDNSIHVEGYKNAF